MSATIVTLPIWLDARRAEIEAALQRYLPGPPHWPAVLHEAMQYSLLAGGKRLRPVLTLAAAEAVAQARAFQHAPGSHAANARGALDPHDAPDAHTRLEAEADARRLALPAACAIEMIHTYSLIHDDLPAMDDDSLRRGRPTSHVQFGEGMAILAGDGLLTEAFALLAREPHVPSDANASDSDPEDISSHGMRASGTSARDTDTDRVSADALSTNHAPAIALRKLRTIGIIADAAGAAGMVGGQAIDLHAARPHVVGATPARADRSAATPSQDVSTAARATAPAASPSSSPASSPSSSSSPASSAFDADALRDMHARKTGALIRAAAVAGAVMAGARADVEAAVAAFAADLGLAFQIVDDVLDVEGTAAGLGKTAGKDAASGKPTYPALFGLDRSKQLAREAADRARAALAAAGLGGRLPEIAAWVVERRS